MKYRVRTAMFERFFSDLVRARKPAPVSLMNYKLGRAPGARSQAGGNPGGGRRAVEAESLEEACKKGISDDADWDTQEMDCEGARRTTITSVKLLPDGYDVDPKRELIVARNEEDPSALDMLSFATFPYENEAETGPLLSL